MNRNALDHSIAKLSHLAAQKSPPDEAKLRAIAKEFKAALDKAAGNPPPALNGLRFRKVAVTVTSRATEFLGLHGDIPDYLNDNEYEDDLDWGSSNQPPDPKTRALIQTYQAWENNVYRVFNQFKRKYPYEFSMARSIYGSNFTV